MLKKQSQQPFSGKNPSTLAKSRLAKVLPEGKGGWIGDGQHEIMHDVVAWWWHETWKDKHAASFFQGCSNQDDKHAVSKLRDFHERFVEFGGVFAFAQVAESPQQRLEPATHQREEMAYLILYIIKIFVDGQGVLYWNMIHENL